MDDDTEDSDSDLDTDTDSGSSGELTLALLIMSMIAWKPYLRVATFHSVNRSVELRSLWISSSLGSDSLIP
jgi:hypothetical protein